jgi:Phosphotransferase enzyme family
MSKQNRAVIWEDAGLGQLEPRWPSDPSIDAIESVLRQTLHTNETIEINFLAQGAFNKLYKINVGVNPASVMRVTLPVDPHAKVESEAATMKLIERQAKFPVPRIIAFDSSSDNELGYEWILMKCMNGQVLEEAWKTMTWPMKEELVRNVARSLAQLFELRFEGIGNVYFQDNASGAGEADAGADGLANLNSRSFELGEMVSMELFWNGRLQQKLNRGPFKGSAEWLATLLQLRINENRAKIEILASGKPRMKDLSPKEDKIAATVPANDLESPTKGAP